MLEYCKSPEFWDELRRDYKNLNDIIGDLIQHEGNEGSFSALETLLNIGMTPNLMIPYGSGPEDGYYSLLSWVATQRSGDFTPAVQILLEHGADPNLPGVRYSPLSLAVSRGNLGMINLLLEHGANIEGISEVWGSPATEIGKAAWLGDVDVFNLLLSWGANLQPSNAHTPLEFASRNDRLSIVQLLIDHGVDVNYVGISGETALTIAAREGKSEIIMFLLNHGTDANIPNSNGSLPLLLGLKSLLRPKFELDHEVLKALASKTKTINIKKKDKFGDTVDSFIQTCINVKSNFPKNLVQICEEINEIIHPSRVKSLFTHKK